MAGEKLLDLINSRGGNANEYADVVFGTVVSTNPLNIQLSEKIVLTDAFLIISNTLGTYKLKTTIDGENKEITVHNELESGDKVTMIRLDGGQQFYVLEKLGG